MEKITIKGFGPIKDAEIEVKKLLVLIGEQASGKSTIAKLIYFFKSLPDEILKAYLSSDHEQIQLESFVKDTVYQLFLDRFGHLISSNSFEINYLNSTTTEFSISISRKESNDTGIEFSSALSAKLQARSFFFDNLRASLRNLEQIKDEDPDLQRRIDANLRHEIDIKRFRREFDAIFEQVAADKFFIIAGRESIESYPEVFARYSQMNHDDGIGTSIWAKETFDEKLLKGFLDQVRFHRKSFLKNGETLKGILKRMQTLDRLGSVASQSSRNYGDD
ncbi:MAG TPA: AAA family ATPase, partial [Bacteroidia bacterium]|nr:AAA family ATPase [Bacteroidia bacterium]